MTPERDRVRNRAYHAAHREQRKAQMRAWYAANRERHKANVRARYAANPHPKRAAVAAYQRSAAGMLATIRKKAKERKQ